MHCGGSPTTVVGCMCVCLQVQLRPENPDTDRKFSFMLAIPSPQQVLDSNLCTLPYTVNSDCSASDLQPAYRSSWCITDTCEFGVLRQVVLGSQVLHRGSGSSNWLTLSHTAWVYVSLSVVRAQVVSLSVLFRLVRHTYARCL
jgi:hypothetical protein